MPLMWREQSLLMEWCLECHRQPERFVRPREYVFSMDWQPPEDQLALGQRLVQGISHRQNSPLARCVIDDYAQPEDRGPRS